MTGRGQAYSVLEMRGFQDELAFENGFVLEMGRFQDEWWVKPSFVLNLGVFQDSL